jgi:hypothetical protein
VRIKANDTEFCVWLRDIKKTETIWVLNYGNIKQLESEFGEYLEVKKTLEKQEKELEEIVLSMKENKYCVC